MSKTIIGIGILVASSAAAADTVLIDDSFTSSTIATSSNISLTNAGNGSGDDWIKCGNVLPGWTIEGGALSSPASNIDHPVSGEVIGQLYTVATTDTSLTRVKVSFDYTVGVGASLRFAANGLRSNGSPESKEALNSTGAIGVNLQDGAAGDFEGISLFTGVEPEKEKGSAVIDGGDSGHTGSYSKIIDLSNFHWSSKGSGKAREIANITDLDYIAFIFANEGTGAVSIDNFKVTALPAPTKNTFMVFGNPYVDFPELEIASMMESIHKAVEDADIDFVIIVGEVTRHAHIDAFKAVRYIMDHAPVPVYVTGSNHDLVGSRSDHDDYARFKSILKTETEYTFSKGRSYFVMQSHDDSVGSDFTNNALLAVEGDMSYDFVYQVAESTLSAAALKGASKPVIGINGGNGLKVKHFVVGGRHVKVVPIEHKDRTDEDDYLIFREHDGYVMVDSYTDRNWDKGLKIHIDRSTGASSVEPVTDPPHLVNPVAADGADFKNHE